MALVSDLRVRVLGPLVVEGVDPSDLGSRKARTLMAALACAPGPVAADVLIEVLWGDAPPSKPGEQLSVLASRLRRVLGAERVVRSDAGYELRADWVDAIELSARVSEAVSRFAATATSAARVAAAAALEIVRGPLAADEDAPWFDELRPAVNRSISQARSILAEAALLTGDPSAAAAAAADALDDDPYDEAALRTLMRSHVALGRPASALAAYARVRERLGDDLGVDPSPETEELHTAILRGETAPAASPVTRAMVGRDDELALLRDAYERVIAGGTGGVLIEGDAGMGKSTLVEAFLETVRDRALVLYGRCDEMGRDLPLQPVLDGLEQQLRVLGDAAAADLLGAELEVLGPLVGRSAEALPSGVTTFGDVESAQAILFRAVLAVIERLAADRPAVVVLEDIHLASSGTLTWLQLALRRGRRIMVITTRRPTGERRFLSATHIDLGPLDLAAAASLVGEDRAADLLARSGGNPLFLVELAAAGEGEGVLPPSIRELVAARTEALGEAANTLRATAVLGAAVDLDLLATVLQLPISTLLDHLERATASRALVEEGGGLRFRHELVRDALVADVSSARSAFLHRETANVLAARPAADPLDVAWHARRGGDVDLAASALLQAARIAASRYDVTESLRLLDDVIELRDDAPARVERARMRMAVWDLADARLDAERAIEMGGGVPALEVAGWVAYYQRAHGDTVRFAEEGVARAADAGLRASCLALLGKTAHTNGDLHAAEDFLERAVVDAGPGLRAVVSIWLAMVRDHQGRDREAIELAARGLLGREEITHPFALPHALFATIQSRGHQGDVLGALAAAGDLDDLVARGGAQKGRYGPIAKNFRAWILRNVGALAEARSYNEAAAGLPENEPIHAEARYAGLLDLTEDALCAGDVERAADLIERTAGVETWVGSMYWRHRGRHRLHRARLALVTGDPATALGLATAVEADCRERGSRRYELLASVVVARAGGPAARDDLDAILVELEDLAGLEVWWITAELAAHFDDDDRWNDAAARLDRLASAAGPYADGLRAWARQRFPELH
jgi:DNA-binding SARP family transcriptional activator